MFFQYNRYYNAHVFCLTITGFGSDFQLLFDKSEPCDKVHIKQATDHISTMNADLGGTEVLQPFQHIFQYDFTNDIIDIPDFQSRKDFPAKYSLSLMEEFQTLKRVSK